MVTTRRGANTYGYLATTLWDQHEWASFPYYTMWAVTVAVPAAMVAYLGWSFWLLPAVWVLMLFPVFALFMYLRGLSQNPEGPCDSTPYLDFHDAGLARKYSSRKIPLQKLYEAYMDGKVDFKMDTLSLFEARHLFCSMRLTSAHLWIFLRHIVPEFLMHTRIQDQTQVREHYERGNDFYRAFLGERMIYTSGIMLEDVRNNKESLEQMQDNKMAMVADKLQLKAGERVLDIGCGWGTLTTYFAEVCGAHATGVTIARDQIQWAEDVQKERKLKGTATMMCCDYRDIPATTYDKISCLEMAEHVGIRRFPSFLKQVKDMLAEDGIFYLQIAGLRRAWQWEDFVWGLFMGRYIFPGADASCPLGWVVNQVEAAGFEVAHVDTVGIHYSATIMKWWENWTSNKDFITDKYGIWWFRLWDIFLAWSTVIARQGNSTCYCITLHKNTNGYDRVRFMGQPRVDANATMSV